MAQSSHRETAKIYQFPIGDRAAKGGLREVAKVADLASAPLANCEFGSGWYHEAAVQEAQLARKAIVSRADMRNGRA